MTMTDISKEELLKHICQMTIHDEDSLPWLRRLEPFLQQEDTESISVLIQWIVEHLDQDHYDHETFCFEMLGLIKSKDASLLMWQLFPNLLDSMLFGLVATSHEPLRESIVKLLYMQSFHEEIISAYMQNKSLHQMVDYVLSHSSNSKINFYILATFHNWLVFHTFEDDVFSIMVRRFPKLLSDLRLTNISLQVMFQCIKHCPDRLNSVFDYSKRWVYHISFISTLSPNEQDILQKHNGLVMVYILIQYIQMIQKYSTPIHTMEERQNFDNIFSICLQTLYLIFCHHPPLSYCVQTLPIFSEWKRLLSH